MIPPPPILLRELLYTLNNLLASYLSRASMIVHHPPTSGFPYNPCTRPRFRPMSSISAVCVELPYS